MSFVKKRPKGYYGVAEYRDSNGKRHQKGAGTFKLKREALAAADKLERELDQINIDLADVTLADYFDRWFELYKSNKARSFSARNQYRIMSKYIRQYFADTRLVSIKRSTYQAFINWYGATHARQSVTKLNGAIRACVDYAIDDDIITRNFARNAEIAYDTTKKQTVEYLSTKELIRLKQFTISKLDPHNTSRYMILTAILTGMRKSEIQALTWKDINPLHTTININKSWDEKNKKFKSTKTATSNRVIKVNPELIKWLEDLKINQSTMVFQNQFHTIPTSNALNKCLRSIMDDAGIVKQGFHFHSLRHVHVAYLLGQGVDVYAISKRLGHANVTITLNTYSYLIDEYKAKNDELITQKLAQLL